MVKRGEALGYDVKTLNFVAGYMHDANRTLFLRSSRASDPAKLLDEPNWILPTTAFCRLFFGAMNLVARWEELELLTSYLFKVTALKRP
jgi:hypothetical protein